MVLGLLSHALIHTALANHQLENELKGRFRRQKMPNHAITIHPDHVKIRFCRKAQITSLEREPTLRKEEIGLSQAQITVNLFTYGDNQPQCLSRGHHNCTFTIGKWDEMTNRLFLILSCDESDFVQMYEKRLHFRRRRR